MWVEGVVHGGVAHTKQRGHPVGAGMQVFLPSERECVKGSVSADDL